VAQFTDGLTEAATATDVWQATVIYAASLVEAATATDTVTATAIFNTEVTETASAADAVTGTVSYWHFPTDRRVELRSVHDVLTDREVVSDPTESHDELLRSQRPQHRR
jgi:hypothetical protein